MSQTFGPGSTPPSLRRRQASILRPTNGSYDWSYKLQQPTHHEIAKWVFDVLIADVEYEDIINVIRKALTLALSFLFFLVFVLEPIGM